VANLELDVAGFGRLVAAGALVALAVVVLNGQRNNPDENIDRDLDLDAAFILEDVIVAVGSGEHRPAMQSLEDFRWQLVPFGLDAGRPRSTAETRAIYPDVASRGTGTNITFPLSANLYFNLGPFYLWLIPVVLVGAQHVFILSVTDRDPHRYRRFMGFMVAVFFIVIVRGGIINSRLLIPGILMTVAFFAGQLILTSTSTKP
jgi:hypothetical protein